MWCSPASILFCLVETNTKSLPEKKQTTTSHIFISFFPSEGGLNCRETGLWDTCDNAPLSYSRGLKWRGGQRTAPHSAVPHQPLWGHRRAVTRREISRWERGCRGAEERQRGRGQTGRADGGHPTQQHRLSSGSAPRRRRWRRQRWPISAWRRLAPARCPVPALRVPRTVPFATIAPSRRPAWWRPAGIKRSAAHVCSSVPAGEGGGVGAVLVVSVWRGSGGGRACRTVTAQPLGARVPVPCEGRRCPPARPRAASAPLRDAGSARPASPHPRAGRSMSAASDTYFLIKDIKPGLKNLNVIFIVLEIGKWRPARPTPGPPTRVTAGGGAGGAVPPLSRASPRRASHQDQGRARGEVLQGGRQDGQHHHLRVGRDRRPHPAGGHHPPDQRVRTGPPRARRAAPPFVTRGAQGDTAAAPWYRASALRSLAKLNPPFPGQNMPSGSVQARRGLGL